ncbi:MAG: hypothetical protein HOW97_22915 [Catenulispora sp.]|nr:hypothetical protein [Catenulispora sp.]
MLLMFVAAGMLGIGLVLILVRNHFKENQDVVLEVGVNLSLFGFTTLLVTLIASQQLEHRLVAELQDKMDEHVKNVRLAMGEVEDRFRSTIEKFLPLYTSSRELGLENIFLTRIDALVNIEPHLREMLKGAASQAAVPQAERGGTDDEGLLAAETSRAADDADDDGSTPRLWFVGTSLKGVLEASTGKFDGAGILSWAAFLAARDLLDLRVLLTQPKFARIRARQEHRAQSAIPEEISEALEFLHKHGVSADCIRMTQASPTVFAIATQEMMLLNPYPYGAEAHRSFSLIVKRVTRAPNDHQSLHRDIFEQYQHRHFETPWRDGLRVVERDGAFVPPEATFNPLAPGLEVDDVAEVEGDGDDEGEEDVG